MKIVLTRMSIAGWWMGSARIRASVQLRIRVEIVKLDANIQEMKQHRRA
jgi:hypothetical protein